MVTITIPKKDQEVVEAFATLISKIEKENKGWKPDWDNNELKYQPWFNMDSNTGFSLYTVRYDYSTSYVSSRLCFKSRDIAQKFVKKNIGLYKAMMF